MAPFSWLRGGRRGAFTRGDFTRMAFNLKKVLKALLLSTNQPLSIKDVQAAFTRFHDQAGAASTTADAASVTVSRSVVTARPQTLMTNPVVASPNK